MSFKRRFLLPNDPDIPPLCEECPEEKASQCPYMKSYDGEPCQEFKDLYDKDLEERSRLEAEYEEALRRGEIDE